jgi:nitric-oxide synthase
VTRVVPRPRSSEEGHEPRESSPADDLPDLLDWLTEQSQPQPPPRSTGATSAATQAAAAAAAYAAAAAARASAAAGAAAHAAAGVVANSPAVIHPIPVPPAAPEPPAAIPAAVPEPATPLVPEPPAAIEPAPVVEVSNLVPVCPITGATAPASQAPRGSTVDFAAAEDFLGRYYAEHPAAGSLALRLREVRAEIDATGTYTHTASELAFGARVAWRNAARCIGRLYWRSLVVRDRREIRNPKEIAGEAADHLRTAFNGGRIRPVITVFAPDTPERPGPRIWNEQLIRYAGYRGGPGGGVTGDPAYVGFTDLVTGLGWAGGSGGDFDVLPLVVDDGDGEPHLFDLPADAVREVPVSHPRYHWFAELGLRWHAVPALANMCLEIGGICYGAAPFSGWYMGTEIGARNFADTDRYDLLPEVGRRLGFDTTSERNLWRDRALVELNTAVLHSFDEAGVTLADHHTESRRFITHLEREEKLGRAVPADWSWIVPPMSGSATPVFHRYYDETELTPAYVHHDGALDRARGTCPHTG